MIFPIGKSGFLDTSAFFQLLELHKIFLSESDRLKITQAQEKPKGYISYKAALRMIQPDVSSGLDIKWNVGKVQREGFSDTQSQVSNWSDLSQFSVDTQMKEQAQTLLKPDLFLNKKKNSLSIVQEEDNVNQNQHSKYAKKQYQIAAKPDQRIRELQEKRWDQVKDGLIAPLQPLESPKKEGKKLISPVKAGQQDIISHGHDNYNTTDLSYKPKLLNLDGALHKSKVSPEYLKKVLNTDNISEERMSIIKQLYTLNIDFRSLNFFRNKLYESQSQENDKLPVEDYQTIKTQIFQDKLHPIEDVLLQEFKSEDGLTIDLQKVTDLVDLYTYLPVQVKKDKNKSEALYFALSQNQRGNHSALSQTTDKKPLNQDLKAAVSIINAKISERFGSMREAFRFFDANLNQAISYSEFQQGLDQLTVKIANDQATQVFQFLDYDNNGSVTFNEFCELQEDRVVPKPTQAKLRRGSIGDESRNQSTITEVQPKYLYITNINMEDLEQISKFQALSTLRKKKYRMQRSEIPKHYQTFGQTLTLDSRQPRLQHVQGESIGEIINHNYLKDYLQDKVTRNAQLLVFQRSQKPKSIHNKSSELRSQSVAKQIQASQIEKDIEDLKMTKGLKNNVSFKNIHKNHLKLKKELALPPISSTRLNSSFQTPSSRLDNQSALGSSHGEVLDEVHKLRMQVIEMKEKSSLNEKPTSMTKRQKEDILASYYEAKKQLKS